MNQPHMILLPADAALPALRAYLAARGAVPLQEATDEQHTAELLERAVRSSERFVAYAVTLAGRPSWN